MSSTDKAFAKKKSWPAAHWSSGFSTLSQCSRIQHLTSSIVTISNKTRRHTIEWRHNGLHLDTIELYGFNKFLFTIPRNWIWLPMSCSRNKEKLLGATTCKLMHFKKYSSVPLQRLVENERNSNLSLITCKT